MIFGRALPPGWKVTRLADVCREITVGHVGPMADKYEISGTPFLRSQNILPFRLDLTDIKFIPAEFHAKLKKSALAPGDVAIVRTGYPGTACVIPATLKDSNCADLVIARPGEKLNPSFLAAVLNSSWGRNSVAGNLVGVAQQHFNVGAAKSMQIALPPLDQQGRIASILSAYDDLIENNTRRIAILEEMTQRIYEEWFVRFRFPGHENVRMVESELGPVPEGWGLRKLGDEIELAYGKALKAEERIPGEVPVFGSSGVVGRHNQSLTDGPGIIVGRKGNVGSVHWSERGFYPIDTVYYVLTKLPLHFVFFNLQRQNFLNNDAAVPGLNRKQAYSLPLLIPPLVLMQRFEEECGSLLGLARVLGKKNANLRTTRDLLLPKLISGELDVSSLPEPEAAVA